MNPKKSTGTKRHEPPPRKPKAKCFCWTTVLMNAAVQAVATCWWFNEPTPGMRRIPCSSHNTAEDFDRQDTHRSKPGKKPLFRAELEIKLVDYSGNLASLGIGFGKSQFLDYARQRVWNATKYIFTICVVLFLDILIMMTWRATLRVHRALHETC